MSFLPSADPGPGPAGWCDACNNSSTLQMLSSSCTKETCLSCHAMYLAPIDNNNEMCDLDLGLLIPTIQESTNFSVLLIMLWEELNQECDGFGLGD